MRSKLDRRFTAGAVLVGLVLVTGVGPGPAGAGWRAAPAGARQHARLRHASHADCNKTAATVGNGAAAKVATTSGVGVRDPAGALPNDVQVSVSASPPRRRLPARPSSARHVFGRRGSVPSRHGRPRFDPAKLPRQDGREHRRVHRGGTLDRRSRRRCARRDASRRRRLHFQRDGAGRRSRPRRSTPARDDRDAGRRTRRLCGYYGQGACGTQSDGCNAFIGAVSAPGGTDAGVDAAHRRTPARARTRSLRELSGRPRAICGQRDNGCGGKLDC